MTCACQLINYTTMQLKKMSVMNQSAHVATTFQLLEISSITTSNQFEYSHKVHFSKSFFRKNIGDFTDLHNEKKNLEVPCKRNCFC